MGKPLVERSLFDGDALERALTLIAGLQKEEKKIERGIKAQSVKLEEIEQRLWGIQKRITEMGQPELFS